ncbi:guanine nucleotide binding protein, alpha subunit [Lanmaoa asiatica]|nr:guanine nucleotide binding protein, alpha subunit [Lanmaoa asiatica]
MYSPASLESERMSWRTVVYFNVVRSIKKILVTLEAWDDIDDGSDSQSTLERQELSQEDPLLVGARRDSFVGLHDGTLSLDAEFASPTASSPMKSFSISDLRRRLLSLVNTEPQLADRLSGGVSVSGSGKGEVYVRNGWQARTIHASQKLIGRRSKRAETENAELFIERPGTATSINVNSDALVDDVATMLDQSREDITTLWEHPVVRALISKRKLKLDEWSEL